MPTKRYIYDRYLVTVGETSDIPPEAYDYDKHKMAEAAIDICRERAKLYCLPAHWEARWKDDNTILVIRKRYRR